MSKKHLLVDNRLAGLHAARRGDMVMGGNQTGRPFIMQVVFHLGAPCTDQDQLILSLLKNRARLAKDNIAVPPPARYRSVIRDTMRVLKGAEANSDVQDSMLEAIIGDAPTDRLILSDPRFVCINRLVIQGAYLWPMIRRTTTQLRNLFPEDQAEFFIGMRDPATLVPALFQSSRFTDFEEFTENMQVPAVKWSEMIGRLRKAQPDCPITVWCNEDTPLLWGEIMRAMAGLSADASLDGVDDLVGTIMEPNGFQRMAKWFAENPQTTETQRRRVVAAFLERYARPEDLEETLNLPGWSEDLIESLSDAYDQDMAALSQIPGVRLLTP
ncbi:hypothetical protein V8J82_18185 [Gymnodinialimonas sp. 2305UL16-5]|uniref:hypothetical protein n=1 Tax=Gymnodinialimonas mytili TaxID=3126503 RepID=UPI0030A6E841